MALSDRFHRGYGRLLGAFDRHRAAPRDPERVTELAAARADLEDRRSEMLHARRDEGFDGWREHNSQFVEPGLGLGETRLRGKVGAVLAGIALVVAALGLLSAARALTSGSGVLLDARVVSEEIATVDGACVWTVNLEVEHDTGAVGDLRLMAVNITATLDGSSLPIAVDQSGFVRQRLSQGEATLAGAVVPLPTCVMDPADVDHGPIRITYAPPTGPLRVIEIDF